MPAEAVRDTPVPAATVIEQVPGQDMPPPTTAPVPVPPVETERVYEGGGVGPGVGVALCAKTDPIAKIVPKAAKSIPPMSVFLFMVLFCCHG